MNGDAEPDLTLGSWHGGNCCASFYLIQLSWEPQLLALTHAEVDDIGWGLCDLDGDGVSELVSGGGGGGLVSLGCPAAIDAPLGVATFDEAYGVYALADGGWLRHCDYVATSIPAMATALADGLPSANATSNEESGFLCGTTSTVLPALVAGAVDEHAVRQLLEREEFWAVLGNEYIEGLLDFVHRNP